MVVTALLLGEAANTPGCRLGGRVGWVASGMGTVAVIEKEEMARVGETTVKGPSSEVVCGWRPCCPQDVESPG